MKPTQLIINKGDKQFDILEMPAPKHLGDARNDEYDFVCIEWKQRLADFESMDAAQKQAFLKKQDITESAWKEKNERIGDIYPTRFTITFEEYDAYAYDANRRIPSDEGWGRGRRPAVNISIVDAIDYANWVNMQKGLAPSYILANYNSEVWIWKHPSAKWAREVVAEAEETLGRELTVPEKMDLAALKACQHIPTSDEWLMCLNRPNETFEYPGSDNLDEVAWYANNSGNQTHPVGELKPNSYGIYDMYGNTWEMTLPEEPPRMTEELWKKYFPTEKYLDFSNQDIFSVIQD